MELREGGHQSDSVEEIVAPESVEQEQSYYYTYQPVPLDQINILPQPRKTFEDIDSLARNIGQKGLIQPVTIAQFDRESCEQYIRTLNEVWGTELTIEELTALPDSDSFFVLIAGERRTRAHMQLGRDVIDARLVLNVNAADALDIQASENTHKAVPPHEEAHFYYRLFKMRRSLDPEYPLSKFADEVGRSPSTIRNALRFCELPDDIQNYVAEKKVDYGITLELARLQQELALPPDDLKQWLLRALVHEYKVPEFRKHVSGYINEKKSGQIVFDFGEHEDALQERQKIHKQVASRIIALKAYQNLDYFKRIRSLYAEGLLGGENSPFSETSPLRLFRLTVIELEELLPYLAKQFSSTEMAETKVTLKQAAVIFELLESFRDPEDFYQLPAVRE